MTVTIKAETIGKTIVTIEVEKYSAAYTVSLCDLVDESRHLYGYPYRVTYYATEAKAKRRFNALVRELRG